MRLPPNALQSFGVHSAVSKELKPESTRSLPYLFSADGKPTVGSTFQYLDNHELRNYGSEKYPHEHGSQNADTEKSCFVEKTVADLFQQHSNFKPLDHIAQNIIATQKESGYKSNSGCGDHLPSMVNGPKNNSTCDSDFVANHFTAQNLVSNLKSNGMDYKHSNPTLKNDSEETDESSNIGSDGVLSEPDVTMSEVLIKCNYAVKKDSQVDVKSIQDDEKLPFETGVMCSSKKILHERKQKYPARCDVKSEESKTTSVSKNIGDCPDNHFSCVSCGLGFVQELLLREHEQSHSDSGNRDNNINGDGCERTGVASDEDEPLDKRLERHLKKAEVSKSEVMPRKFLCEYCNKYFDFVSQLNRHRKCHLSEGKGATLCRHCGKKYTNRACLIKHESQHTGIGVFKCRQCGDGFNSKQEYRSHRAKQHGKQWRCSECQRCFSNSSNLKNHYNNKHLGREAKSYACNVCGKLFKQKGNLKVHVDSRCGSEPRHICNICGKAFMSGGSLGTHSLLHTGVKTFLCRFCGKSYRLKVEMQRHERSHTGEKPFVCKVCNKAFAHRESLVTHNTLHTGIRPYMCEACGSTFSCIGNLIKHRQTHNRRCDIARQ
jgi:uncharacterized Zn-finger protein